MDSGAEGQMGVLGPVDIDLVGVVEHGWVAVGGAKEQAAPAAPNA